MKIKKAFKGKRLLFKQITSKLLVICMIFTILGAFPKNAYAVAQESIGGRVFYDANGNGKIESNKDLGVVGVKVELYLNNNNSYVYQKETTTTSTGDYYFYGLDSSNLYKVRVISPSGYGFTKIGNGKGGGVQPRISKVDPTGIKIDIKPTDMDINAGLIEGTSPNVTSLAKVGIQVKDTTGNVGETYNVESTETKQRVDKNLNPSVFLLGDSYAKMSVAGSSVGFFQYQFLNQNNIPTSMPTTDWIDMDLDGSSYNDDVETDKPGKLKWRSYDVNHMLTLTDTKNWSDPLQVFKYPSDATGYKTTNISSTSGTYGGFESIPSYTVKSVDSTKPDVVVNKKWVSNSAFMGSMSIGGDYKEASKFWGYIKVPEDGDYQFGSISDDGSKGSITVVGQTNTFANMFKPQSSTFGTSNKPYSLKANQYYPIYLEYFNWGGSAEFRMVYNKGGNVSSSSYNVPTNWFYPSKSNEPGENANTIFTGEQGIKLPTEPGNYYIAYQTGNGTDIQREGFYGSFVVENRLALSKTLVGGGNTVQQNLGFNLQYTIQPKSIPVNDSFRDTDGKYRDYMSISNITLRDEYPQGIVINNKNATVEVNGQSAITQNITVNDTMNSKNVSVKSIEAKIPSAITYNLNTVDGKQVYTASPVIVKIPLKANDAKDNYSLSDSGKSMLTYTELDGKGEKQMEFPTFVLRATSSATVALSRALSATKAYLKQVFTITYALNPTPILTTAIAGDPLTKTVRDVRFTETLPVGINVDSSSLPQGVTLLGQTLTGNIPTITYTLNANNTAYEASPVLLSITAFSINAAKYVFGGDTTISGSYTNVNGISTPTSYIGTNTIDIQRRKLVIPSINVSEDWTSAAMVPVTITAEGIDSVVKTQYSLDNSTWIDYTGNLEITQEGQTIVYARTIDDVGYTSDVSNKTIKIDRTAPTAPTITLTTENWTKDNVEVTIAGGSSLLGIKKYQYKIGAGEWIDYSSVLKPIISSNGQTTVLARAVSKSDSVGVQTSKVAKIDKIVPTGNVTGIPIKWVSTSAVLTLKASDGGSGVKQVRVQKKDGSWQNWVNGDTMTYEVYLNGSYNFQVEDNAGNTNIINCIVSRISMGVDYF
ncbi:hypothetical protein KPL37_11850 [Clostridium frigoris]|uniref:PA14 domain-containing protein n=1 Tax=Clostridium frigoris TaxID=205327 RepID=A0ABS6BWL2_9CLOT|nr:SdrD B-like domain-containing protein [Clostridium frigoris]MBU3160437.1 hypothetical protein [Clostridium frigoris]